MDFSWKISPIKTRDTIDKSSLLDDFILAAASALEKFEEVFELEGIPAKYFGVAAASDVTDVNHKVREGIRARIRSSMAWRSLTRLYDYAVDGVLDQSYVPLDLVIEGQEVLSLIDLENSDPGEGWRRIVDLGAARFALDTDQLLPPESVALLAAVDVRTVRNAISAGDLKTSKSDGSKWIDSASARNWLASRRGFKPTVLASTENGELVGLDSPVKVGSFLRSRRELLGKSPRDDAFVAEHPAFDKRTIENVEAGIFQLPVDAVFPLADFYELNRAELLETVMRVFFDQELAMLQSLIKGDVGDRNE